MTLVVILAEIPQWIHPAKAQKHCTPLFHWLAAFIAKMTKGVNKPNTPGDFRG
jgi:hypothetical protein